MKKVFLALVSCLLITGCDGSYSIPNFGTLTVTASPNPTDSIPPTPTPSLTPTPSPSPSASLLFSGTETNQNDSLTLSFYSDGSLQLANTSATENESNTYSSTDKTITGFDYSDFCPDDSSGTNTESSYSVDLGNSDFSNFLPGVPQQFDLIYIKGTCRNQSADCIFVQARHENYYIFNGDQTSTGCSYLLQNNNNN